MDNNTLKHYGVLGMKWGVRRTPAQLGNGKSSRVKEKMTPFGKKKTVKPDETKPKKRTIKDLSDAELQERIKRLDLEKRYKDLSTSVNPPKSTKGKDFALRVLEKIGENTLVNIGTQAANKALGEAINKAFGVDSKDTINRIVNPNKGQSDKK